MHGLVHDVGIGQQYEGRAAGRNSFVQGPKFPRPAGGFRVQADDLKLWAHPASSAVPSVELSSTKMTRNLPRVVLRQERSDCGSNRLGFIARGNDDIDVG